MSRKRYERERETRKAGIRILAAALGIMFCLSAPTVYAGEAEESQKQKNAERQTQETKELWSSEITGQQLQNMQDLLNQMDQGLQQEEAYTEAIVVSATFDSGITQWYDEWSLTSSVISYDGYTYVLTAGNFDVFAQGGYCRMLIGRDGGTQVDLFAMDENNLVICCGHERLEGLTPLPVGELDPETGLKAAYCDYNEEEGFMLRAGELEGSLERAEGGYILDWDLGTKEKWNGALVVSEDTEEVVGIGSYQDGQYWICDIPTGYLSAELAVENWGEMAEAEEETQAEAAGDPSPMEPVEEPEETEGTRAADETEAVEGTEDADGAEDAAETEPPAGYDGQEEEADEKSPDEKDDSVIAAVANLVESLPNGAWIAILAGIVAAAALAENKKKKENLHNRPEDGNSYRRDDRAEAAPPSGTIQLGPGERQSQYILECLSGPTAGKQVVIYDNFSIGRDPQNSDLVLPEDTKGVSRRHCRIEIHDGLILLRDLGSSYGTFLENGLRLEAQTPYSLDSGTVFYVGSRQIAFRVTRK